ncbi:hypothetical protein D3C76_20000 [compost metagenome]
MIDWFYLFIKMLLILYFLSSVAGKFSNINKLKTKIRNYNIVPISFVNYLAIIDISFDLIVSISFIIGVLPFVFTLFALVILLIPSFAILVVALKGNKTKNAVVTNNKEISKSLLYRLPFIGLCILLLYLNNYNNSSYIFNIQYICLLIASLTLYVCVLISIRIWKIFRIIATNLTFK